MKRALIVDDSKTAQTRLKKMLLPYSLDVDIAFSAEEALGYLAYEAPTIIFLDHHMEGMDGLEALKIIKANPNTAMIPVVMYTAQKGDMYVGQARALGALDILSKEIMKASSLQRVLASLGIQPMEGAETPEVAFSAESPKQEAAQSPAVVTQDAQEVTVAPHQIEPLAPTTYDNAAMKPAPEVKQITEEMDRLLEVHIAEIRQQISDNSRTIVYKVSEEIEKSLDREPKVGDIPLSVIRGEVNEQQRRSSVISSSLLVLIFLGLALVGYELINTKNEMKFLTHNYNEVAQKQSADADAISAQANQIEAEATEQENINLAIFDITSWAINTDWHFEYGSPPLDEKRVINISNLIYRLASMGFRGKVDLVINFGNVCLQHEDSGLLRLADSDLPVENCVMFHDINPDFLVSDYLSLAYLNFEQSAAPIKNGVLDVEVTTNGISAPRYEYPEPDADSTAGDWNKIALKNNHIGVSFSY